MGRRSTAGTGPSSVEYESELHQWEDEVQAKYEESFVSQSHVAQEHLLDSFVVIRTVPRSLYAGLCSYLEDSPCAPSPGKKSLFSTLATAVPVGLFQKNVRLTFRPLGLLFLREQAARVKAFNSWPEGGSLSRRLDYLTQIEM
jgi:hypothetical protein